LAEAIARMPADERQIIEQLVTRMEKGRRGYGPWHVSDGRDYPVEALLEVLDALHYCAAELVRLSRGDDGRSG
jgi:hypothetical protein